MGPAFETVEDGVKGDDCFKGGISRSHTTALGKINNTNALVDLEPVDSIPFLKMLCSISWPPLKSSDLLRLHHNNMKNWSTSDVVAVVTR